MMAMLLLSRRLRIPRAALAAAAPLLLSSAGVLAQESASEAGPRRSVAVEPRVVITETLTNNVRLVNSGRQSDQVTEISPGIRIRTDGERLKGYFDYSLRELVYAQGNSSRRSENALTTFATLEAVDNWAYLDFNGSIAQQIISAFGTQSSNDAAINSNRTEVAHYRLSPYVRGRLGDTASYEARLSRTVTRGEETPEAGVATSEGSVKMTGGSSFRNLDWLAEASQQQVDYSAGRSTEVDRLNLGLSYLLSPQLRVSVQAGREANNYISFDKKNYGTGGFGVDWTPSERTKLSAFQEHRSFGNAHNLSFEHRTARTVWKLTDTKDASATPSQTGLASLGSIYDLLYSQFEAIAPNPVARAQLVRAFLQAYGLSSDATIISSFLTSAVSLQRRQDLSFALLGVRDTVTFLATRSENNRLDMLSRGGDDLSTASVVRQRGFSVNYAHRLTPDYTLGVLLSRQHTSGSISLQDATLRLFNVNVTGKVGKRSVLSVGIQRTVSSGNTAAYVETAIIGSLNVQF